MESCLSYVFPHTRVQSIVGILKTTAHNAFPVVTLDTDVSGTVSDVDYLGNPVSSNVQYAMATIVRGVTSEQRQRGKTTFSDSTGQSGSDRGLSSDRGLLSGRGSTTRGMDIDHRKPRRTDATATSGQHSRSAPLQSFLRRGRETEEKQNLLHGDELQKSVPEYEATHGWFLYFHLLICCRYFYE